MNRAGFLILEQQKCHQGLKLFCWLWNGILI